MPERSENVWAPWRMDYIEGLSEGESPPACFLCHYHDHPDDASQHVIWRSARSLTLLNRFPYTTGHLLVAPTAHRARLDELDAETLQELTARLRDGMRLLDRVLKPHGYNVGMNLGRCAGAGLPDHLHWHIVPRWGGDTNFMSVVGGARVIPQDLDTTYANCLKAAAELGV
ncbi:MAG: HIT domain-containing protein [Phycisphaerales bacterium]|nr:HIT domain-containing protein [Phycisphaerales bacterium]